LPPRFFGAILSRSTQPQEVNDMATTRLIPVHVKTGSNTSSAVSGIIDYVENPEKTEDGRLITAYECDPKYADEDFMIAKEEYLIVTGREQGRRDIIAYHLRQSFKPGEITPEEANRIGCELAMRLTKGNHQFVVCTHTDKRHIHNHIIFNSTNISCDRKFKNFFNSSKAIRRISDTLCVENGLSVVENPANKSVTYDKWLGDNRKLSQRDKLRGAIDFALNKKPKDFDAFVDMMKDIGYKAKRGKHIAFIAEGGEIAMRCDTLKGNHTEQAIRDRIAGKAITGSSGGHIADAPASRLQFLIDIENSVKAKNSPGYERWAKVFNLKQMAQSVLLVQESGADSFENLSEKASQESAKFHVIKDKIAANKTRMGEISRLQKSIGTYSRTRDVYVEYRKAGYSKKFYNEHAEEIELHKSAKEAFSSVNGKLPTIAELKKEYAALSAESKILYQEYRPARETMIKWLTAKSNIERILDAKHTDKNKVGERSEQTAADAKRL
jgi:hypothetical protein